VYNLNHSTFKQFALLAMQLIPLGLSTISLAQAMEVEQAVHQLHQCKFYDAVNQALATSLNLPAEAEKMSHIVAAPYF